MDKKIYHGGERIVRSPAFGTGRPYNDFGLGFYCTEYPQYAAEWAVGAGKKRFCLILLHRLATVFASSICAVRSTPPSTGSGCFSTTANSICHRIPPTEPGIYKQVFFRWTIRPATASSAIVQITDASCSRRISSTLNFHT